MVDILAVAELFVLGWGLALTTLGFTGVAKYIWNIITTSTEEAVVETKVLKALSGDKAEKR